MYRIPYENEQITKTISAPYAPVDFTEEEKEQFRENIGAGSGSGGGRNLLDNPFFTVNQRGATTVSGDSYGVDRWLGRYDVISNGVALVSGAYRYAEQRLGEPSNLNGKEVTFSIKSNGVIHTKTFTFNNTRIVCTLTNNIPAWNISENATPRVLFQSNGEIRHEIKAVKLELGEKSTLENDIPPDYATELLKCQRYYYRINGVANSMFAVGHMYSAATFLGHVQFPIAMRTPPTQFTYSSASGFKVVTDRSYTSSALYMTNPNAQGTFLQVEVSGAIEGKGADVRFATASDWIAFSADL